MNILIVTYLFYPEPIVMSTITGDLAMELSDKHNVTVLRPNPCRPYGYKFDSRKPQPVWPFKEIVIDSYTCPESDFFGRLRENFSFGRGVRRYVRSHHDEIDVIYMSAFPLFAQKMILKTAEQYRIPVVNHVEDIYPEPFRHKLPFGGGLLYYMLLPIDKWIMRHATFSVVIGPKIREFFIRTRGADPSRVKVVYNWQDESRFYAVQSSERCSKPFTFMYAGSISRAANLQNILQGFIEASIPEARLVFAGSGTEKEALQRKAALSQDVDVSFIDAQSDRIAEIQSEADVLLLPLLPEVALRALPSKFPAYLFSGKPVLACVEDESDVAEIIRSGKCGWIIPPQKRLQLAKTMQRIAHIDRRELQEMGRSGYEYSQKHLTREINLRKLANIVLAAAETQR